MINQKPGLPASRIDGKFIVYHKQHGIMLAQWWTLGGYYIATGFSGMPSLPFQMVAIQDEQVALIDWHAPIASPEPMDPTLLAKPGEGAEVPWRPF